MAAGYDAGRAVVAGEVDERDHRRELQLGLGPRDVVPDGFVAVQHLLGRARAALQEMAEVELEGGARGQQHTVADREQQRVAHHVGGEGARDRGDTRDLFRERPVERGQHRVEDRLVGIRGGDRGLDLGVDAGDDLGFEQALDDHRTVAVECGVGGIRTVVDGQPFECRSHRPPPPLAGCAKSALVCPRA